MNQIKRFIYWWHTENFTPGFALGGALLVIGTIVLFIVHGDW